MEEGQADVFPKVPEVVFEPFISPPSARKPDEFSSSRYVLGIEDEPGGKLGSEASMIRLGRSASATSK